MCIYVHGGIWCYIYFFFFLKKVVWYKRFIGYWILCDFFPSYEYKAFLMWWPIFTLNQSHHPFDWNLKRNQIMSAHVLMMWFNYNMATEIAYLPFALTSSLSTCLVYESKVEFLLYFRMLAIPLKCPLIQLSNAPTTLAFQWASLLTNR